MSSHMGSPMSRDDRHAELALLAVSDERAWIELVLGLADTVEDVIASFHLPVVLEEQAARMTWRELSKRMQEDGPPPRLVQWLAETTRAACRSLTADAGEDLPEVDRRLHHDRRRRDRGTDRRKAELLFA